MGNCCQIIVVRGLPPRSSSLYKSPTKRMDEPRYCPWKRWPDRERAVMYRRRHDDPLAARVLLAGSPSFPVTAQHVEPSPKVRLVPLGISIVRHNAAVSSQGRRCGPNNGLWARIRVPTRVARQNPTPLLSPEHRLGRVSPSGHGTVIMARMLRPLD